MSRFYGPADADAMVPDLATVTGRLRDQRDELVDLRDAYRTREGDLVNALIANEQVADDDPELRRIRLRMRGIVDQMQADVAWLDERDIVLRDISTGLLDFPALAAGRPVWLCWRFGEDRVEYWHGTDEGFAGRKPLAALPDGAASSPEPRPALIRQGDRDKAYRPIPEPARRVAFEAGLAAYARGEHFEAHELLEPAWMGTDDLAERALHQGLIKVAAAYVHAGRGNPPGIIKNLAGARRHLALAGPVAEAWGVDVVALLADVDARLADPSFAAIAHAPVIRRTPRA